MSDSTDSSPPAAGSAEGGQPTQAWQLFDLQTLKGKLDEGVSYKEFLRVPSLSCGVYHLPAGSKDMQSPHDEDEVYLVLEGKARMKMGDTFREVAPGNVLYIQATAEHSFFEIEEDMTLLVFFARFVE